MLVLELLELLAQCGAILLQRNDLLVVLVLYLLHDVGVLLVGCGQHGLHL